MMGWLWNQQPISKDDSLASYTTIERVALAIGLAMRDLAAQQFTDDSELPERIINSLFTFQVYEQLSHIAEDLVKGFEHL